MARIRTIKPEFCQSESMGRVSRDARLCFIQLWTISDDGGRLRGNPLYLAGALFPYDDDARTLIVSWLDELEREGCIQRYQIGRDSYIQIANWQDHQKIDKPTPSRLPSPPNLEGSATTREDSREIREDSIAPREDSALDRKGMEGNGEDWRGGEGERTSRDDACPHQAVIDAYHELCPTGRRVREWTPRRREHLRARWREAPERRSIDWWRKFFGYVAESDFLSGRSRSPDRKPFELSLDWLIAPENFAKTIEGKYHGGGE